MDDKITNLTSQLLALAQVAAALQPGLGALGLSAKGAELITIGLTVAEGVKNAIENHKKVVSAETQQEIDDAIAALQKTADELSAQVDAT